MTKRKRLLRNGAILLVLAAGAIAGKICIWDSQNNRWLIQDLYYKPSQTAKLTIAPPLTTRVDDASKLNATQVAALFQPTTVADIQAIVRLARRDGKKVSISGARHSMGGQIAYPNALHLDMRAFDRLRYNPGDRTITVQSGATWRQIQEELGKYGRAVRVMQDSNIFTVGGSLAVNAHGKDARFGSLIESVNSFKLVNAAGQELPCSRTQNPDLFRAAIGGMGLLGVITEVNLKTTENVTYDYAIAYKPRADIVPFMEATSQQPGVEMIEAQVSVDAANFLQEAQVYFFTRVAANPRVTDDVSGENNIWLRKLVYRTSRASDWGKQFRWFMQKQVGPSLDPKQLSRNSAMAAPFRTLELDDPLTTDVLQEYFVPTARCSEFLSRYAALLQAHQIQLVNVTIRKVNPDTEALVSYATAPMYGFVAYYTIARDRHDDPQVTRFTRDVVDLLREMQGTYYLAYNGYYTRSQLLSMYPAIAELIALKQQHDPQEIFANHWYAQFLQKS